MGLTLGELSAEKRPAAEAILPNTCLGKVLQEPNPTICTLCPLKVRVPSLGGLHCCADGGVLRHTVAVIEPHLLLFDPTSILSSKPFAEFGPLEVGKAITYLTTIGKSSLHENSLSINSYHIVFR